MSKTFYIASTLATAVQYTGWSKSDDSANIPQVEISVTIAGGAGVANKRIVTPRGVVTPVDEAQMQMLSEHEVFKRHKERGFVQILDSKPADADEVAADMTGRDTSAPLVEEDFANKDEAPAVVAGRGTGNGGGRRK